MAEFGAPPAPPQPLAPPPQSLSQATRFFVLRSDILNLQESLRRWVWVVSRRQQANLSTAFRDGRVMLLFAPTGCPQAMGVASSSSSGPGA